MVACIGLNITCHGYHQVRLMVCVWKRHALCSRTGVYDAIDQHVMALKDAEGNSDWGLSVDGTMSRAHQHATKTPRPDQHTGGSYILQEFLAAV